MQPFPRPRPAAACCASKPSTLGLNKQLPTSVRTLIKGVAAHCLVLKPLQRALPYSEVKAQLGVAQEAARSRAAPRHTAGQSGRRTMEAGPTTGRPAAACAAAAQAMAPRKAATGAIDRVAPPALAAATAAARAVRSGRPRRPHLLSEAALGGRMGACMLGSAGVAGRLPFACRIDRAPHSAPL